MYALGFGHTDTGRKRTNNEDALLVDNDLGLYMVCDGMGGHVGGEVASRRAIEVVRGCIASRKELIESIANGETPYMEAVALVEGAVQDACAQVHEMALSRPEYAGMGTTLTLLLMLSEKAVMAHVGDTRLFMLRGNRLHQLSTDHTMAMELALKGAIELAQVPESPYANVLSRAVGTQVSVEVDTLLFDILPADVFMLCTDGLTKHMPRTSDLLPFLSEDLESAPRRLVDHANGQGGRDNVTVLAVKVVAYETERETLVEMDTEVNVKIGALSSSLLFGELTMAQLAKVLEVCEIHDVSTAQVVVEQGQVNTCMNLVIDGRLEITRKGLVIGQITAGDLVGETTLLSCRPARSTLRATEPTRLLRIDGEGLKILVQRRPYLGILFLEQLGRRLGQALDRAHDIISERSLDVDETHLEPADLF